MSTPCRWPLIIFKAARFITVEQPLHVLRNVLTNLISHANKRQLTDKHSDKQTMRDILMKSDRKFTAPMCACSLCTELGVMALTAGWRKDACSRAVSLSKHVTSRSYLRTSYCSSSSLIRHAHPYTARHYTSFSKNKSVVSYLDSRPTV